MVADSSFYTVAFIRLINFKFLILIGLDTQENDMPIKIPFKKIKQ